MEKLKPTIRLSKRDLDGCKPSGLSDLLVAIPTTWLDSILTGEEAVVGQPPYYCQDIERLLQAIKKRMESIINGG